MSVLLILALFYVFPFHSLNRTLNGRHNSVQNYQKIKAEAKGCAG